MINSRNSKLLVVLFVLQGIIIPVFSQSYPEWIYFPKMGEKMPVVSPEKAGLDTARFNKWANAVSPEIKMSGGQPRSDYGLLICRGGRIIRTWGDIDFKHQSASLGKAFLRLALQLAIDEKLIGSEHDRVVNYWTGEGQLNGIHKYLTNGFNKFITFYDLKWMTSGIPISNGYWWRISSDKDVPEWARWTGDPDYDNYAHIMPGTQTKYSSASQWRFSQVLTAILSEKLNMSIKEYLDTRVFSKIGIPADDWSWISGKELADDSLFYPDLPGYGKFNDPPYKINGKTVYGGGGWVVMSARQFARIGILLSTGGVWNGERLVSELPDGIYSSPTSWYAVQSCKTQGWGRVDDKEGYFSWGQLNVSDDSANIPDIMELESWVIKEPDPIKETKVDKVSPTNPPNSISEDKPKPGDLLLLDSTFTVNWSREARFNGCWIVSLPMKPGMAGDWAERNWHKGAHYKGSVTIMDMQRPFSINSGIAEAKVGSGEIGRHSAFEISRSITKPGSYYFSQGTPYSHTPHPPGKEGTDFHNMNSIFFIISKQYQMWTAEAFARDPSYYPITFHYKLYLSYE